MCQVLVTFTCGHTRVQKLRCDRSRYKPGLGNFLKYALFEKPCEYDIPKRRNKRCRACESHLDELRDYKTSFDKERERKSSGSHSDHEHRHHRKHSDKQNSDTPSSSKSAHKKVSHSDRSSRRHGRKSSREEKRGRPTRPRSLMDTIDESAPLPPVAVPEYSEGVHDSEPESPLDESTPVLRDDGSSINDFRNFIQAAERADAEQRAAQGLPNFPERDTSQARMPRPPSSVYQPARADWQPKPTPTQQARPFPPGRPLSSVYSQPSWRGPLPTTTYVPPQQDNETLPATTYKPPSRKGSTLRAPSVSTGSRAAVPNNDDASWVSVSVHTTSDGNSALGATTLPTSNNVTPPKIDKSSSPVSHKPLRPVFKTDPWSQDPIDAFCKNITKEARDQLRDEAGQSSSDLGASIRNSAPAFVPGPDAVRASDPHNSIRDSMEHSRGDFPQPAPFPSQADQIESFGASLLHADHPRVDEPNLKMHFSCYRDPNNPKPPPKPTPSSTGSQVYQNPRKSPLPPGPSGTLPLPNSGFNSHRLARQDLDNVSHMTRWSDLCPPNVNSNIKVRANEQIKATHNGKPVHVVDPKIIEKSWGKNADGRSTGKVSQRKSDNSKKSGSNYKAWFSKLKPEASEASFGCADAAKHDELNNQKPLGSRKSNRSSNSKSKKK